MSQQTVRAVWRNAALAVAIVTALGIAGCGKKAEPAAPVASGPAESAASTAQTPTAAPVESDADLLTKAKTAENEKRLYAPAGDNAIEYYLALRARNPNDEAPKSALTDLFPYAMIATEQTLQKASASKDPAQAQAFRTEAARIFALLERVDANAPSLPRLRETMQKEASAELKSQQDAAKKAQDDLEKKAEADKAATAAKQTAAASAAQSGPPATVSQPPPQATQPVVTRPAPVQPPPQAIAPPPAQPPAEAQPKPARTGLPDVISSAQPTYPPTALRDGTSGEVTVSFTVNADGSVGEASVVSSKPRRVFDAAALEAIKRWKFEAPGEPVTGKRTFQFNPGN